MPGLKAKKSMIWIACFFSELGRIARNLGLISPYFCHRYCYLIDLCSSHYSEMSWFDLQSRYLKRTDWVDPSNSEGNTSIYKHHGAQTAASDFNICCIVSSFFPTWMALVYASMAPEQLCHPSLQSPNCTHHEARTC
jgi:hypothetical protein